MNFVQFIDIIGVNAHRAPFVPGGLRAYYATGTQGIEETAAQIAAAKAAGMGVVLIDQTPSLSVFAAGLADIADVERYAGTPAAAAAAVRARQARGWKSTLYVSYSSLPALRAAIGNPEGVLYGVANYSWSLTASEQLLTQHADWAYIQYGDPASNPHTLVPGTNVTLQQAQADIDVGKAAWANEFLPGRDTVTPAPRRPAGNTPDPTTEEPMLILNGDGAQTPVAIPDGIAGIRLAAARAATVTVEFPGMPSHTVDLHYGGPATIPVPKWHVMCRVVRVAGKGTDVPVSVAFVS